MHREAVVKHWGKEDDVVNTKGGLCVVIYANVYAVLELCKDSQQTKEKTFCFLVRTGRHL